jgi:hypothetical protein
MFIEAGRVWWYTCNPSTLEAQAVGSQVQGQSELHSKTLSQINKIKYIPKNFNYLSFHYYNSFLHIPMVEISWYKLRLNVISSFLNYNAC